MNQKSHYFIHLQLKTYFPAHFQWNDDNWSLRLFLLDLLWWKTYFSIFIYGLFCSIDIPNWQLYRKSKIFRLIDSTIIWLVSQQTVSDRNTWNYAQKTSKHIFSYVWKALRANIKILVWCMTSLVLLWKTKQNSTQIAPGHAMLCYLDDGCNARAWLTSALL